MESFNYQEANLFNDTLDELAVLEIPLLDRAFTWTNNREYPTLVKLDRVFVNLSWDHTFPNTSLTSLTRHASDHVPLVTRVSTSIPKSHYFRFENSWLLSEGFKGMIASAWPSSAHHSLGKRFLMWLKNCRRVARRWSKRRRPAAERESNLPALITVVDLLEEQRSLTTPEARLRQLAVGDLRQLLEEKVLYWKQRFHIKVAIEGGTNTAFLHAQASARMRRNSISVLEHEGAEFYSHEVKASLLKDFYTGLLGSVTTPRWHFSLADLYPTLAVADAGLSAPFSREEVRHALFDMNFRSSPGPDGFDPSFYRAFWPDV